MTFLIGFRIIAFLIISSWSFTVAAQEISSIIVTAEGLVIVGDDMTPGQAKASALNNARRTALEKATGLEVHGSSTVYNFQLINDLVMISTRGLIVKEKVLESRCQIKDDQIYCISKIEAAVKPLNLERRGDFAVTKVTVNRPDKKEAVKSLVFQCLDEIDIHATTNYDAYLNIFSVDQNGNILKLYPNEFCSFEKTRAGKELIFPEAAQRKNGLRLKVRTPKGINKAVESVLIVATKDKVEFLRDKTIENRTVTDLIRELSDLDPSLWAEKTVGYEVRE
jgi:hypothetical protein